MYTSEQIDDLNHYGVLSSALLGRRYKLNFEYARLVLASIVQDYENVKLRTQDQIYIEGRELEEWKPKLKRKRIRPIKPPRWKDVTKP